MRRALELVTTCAALLWLAGCSETPRPAQVADRDLNYFTSFVMPVLLRDCGFQACHGSQERFFRVWGPGRTRFDPMQTPDALAPLTGYERDYSYQLALSMIDADDPGQSMLLRKPLAAEAGGASHEGVDKYGRNIYRTPDDDGYLILAQWVYSDPASELPAGGSGATGTAGAPAVPGTGGTTAP